MPKALSINSPVSLKSALLLSSAQDGIYALGKARISSTPSLRNFPTLPLKQFQCLSDNGLLSSFQGRSSSASSFHAFLLQAIDGVMSLALCPQVVSQTSQHFRFSEKQATCEACMSRAVHPQEFFKVDAEV